MTRARKSNVPDLDSDPFAEQATTVMRDSRVLLGCRVEFESSSRELLELVRVAYADLPPQALPGRVPQLRVSLILTSGERVRRRDEPPHLQMLAGSGFLGAAVGASGFVVLSAQQRAALVVVPRSLLRFPYHIRYELIEFAVFTLATRVRGLVPLHAACVGRGGNGILLLGDSGAGKSTVSLLSLLAGMEFLSEDSVFVLPDTLAATGVANFVHVRASSVRWLERADDARRIREALVIRRRSGVRKFEVDLRQKRYRVAGGPQQIRALVFLSADSAGDAPLLRPLGRKEMLSRLTAAQPYASGQPGWRRFCARLSGIDALELRRGTHPRQSVAAIDSLLPSARPAVRR